MSEEQELESRLAQGLKRWAEAGEPTLDLATHVQQRVATEGHGNGESSHERSQRGWLGLRWRRWVAGCAAVALLVTGLGVTFPTWAGAAADWPLVGPVITEALLNDAGLKWAYENGLMQGRLAEQTQGGVTARILGVVADARRTTVLYQVRGLPSPERRSERPLPGPLPVWERSQQVDHPVSGWITKVNGKGTTVIASPPTETALGYIGTTSTLPLEEPEGELEVTIKAGELRFLFTLTASREETDRLSREVILNQSQEFEGVRITLERVIYTPAETLVEYREELERLSGITSQIDQSEWDHIEAAGERHHASGGYVSVGGIARVAYPLVSGPARFVVPLRVKGVPIEAEWPLEEGAVATVMGVPVTLTQVERHGQFLELEWESPAQDPYRGVGSFEVIGQDGKAYDPNKSESGWTASNHAHDGRRFQSLGIELPPGVEPVLIRARQAAVAVKGPWIFEWEP